MDDSRATSLEPIRAFLTGSSEVRFAGQGRDDICNWVEQTLSRHRYSSLQRPKKGLIRRYLVQRLIAQFAETGWSSVG